MPALALAVPQADVQGGGAGVPRPPRPRRPPQPRQHVLHEQHAAVPQQHAAADRVLPVGPLQGRHQPQESAGHGRPPRRGLRRHAQGDVGRQVLGGVPVRPEGQHRQARAAVRRVPAAGLAGAHELPARRPPRGLQPRHGQALPREGGGRRAAGRRGGRPGMAVAPRPQPVGGAGHLRRPAALRGALRPVPEGVDHLRPVPVLLGAGAVQRDAPDHLHGVPVRWRRADAVPAAAAHRRRHPRHEGVAAGGGGRGAGRGRHVPAAEEQTRRLLQRRRPAHLHPLARRLRRLSHPARARAARGGQGRGDQGRRRQEARRAGARQGLPLRQQRGQPAQPPPRPQPHGPHPDRVPEARGAQLLARRRGALWRAARALVVRHVGHARRDADEQPGARGGVDGRAPAVLGRRVERGERAVRAQGGAARHLLRVYGGAARRRAPVDGRQPAVPRHRVRRDGGELPRLLGRRGVQGVHALLGERVDEGPQDADAQGLPEQGVRARAAGRDGHVVLPRLQGAPHGVQEV
mmetsp:Transcript_2340/g.7872  ORF Transcript_2340/g.7872 Transcript_2340/m.7872 type:complete len:520 (-) Transcript_2340:552-2111(-)